LNIFLIFSSTEGSFAYANPFSYRVALKLTLSRFQRS
jgi:hypothetical protein